MGIFWLIAFIALWLIVLFLGFLLLGTLRTVGLLRWRLEQLEAIMPSRVGRSGLRPGKQAPDFTLPSVAGPDVSLHDFAGRKVLLVFSQNNCKYCHRVMPDLARQQRGDGLQVLVINNGDPDTTRKWAAQAQAGFPILIQENWQVSRRYEMFATPFAFLINERGLIASKGIINNAEHIRYVLSAPDEAEEEHEAFPPPPGDKIGSAGSVSTANVEESDHVRKTL
jgi:methylamine dehydrogenase accessory protein MauD